MRRIIVGDDHVLIRKGLVEVLKTGFPCAIIDEASDAETLLAKVLPGGWDLVITDISMPGKSGLDVIRDIRHQLPKLPVLVLSMLPEEQYGIRAIRAGAAGYLSKMSTPEEVIQAVNQVFTGKKYISAIVANQLVVNLHEGSNKDPHENLSPREFEIFNLLVAGKSVTDIADQVLLSTSSVSTYRARVLEKMNLKTNADLIFYSFKHKLN